MRLGEFLRRSPPALIVEIGEALPRADTRHLLRRLGVSTRTIGSVRATLADFLYLTDLELPSLEQVLDPPALLDEARDRVRAPASA